VTRACRTDDHRTVIRDVILHVNGEQPLLADLFEAPSPGDVGLRCTNLRQMNGKRPVFVDDIASIFFFPYLHLRFVEIPPASQSGGDGSLAVRTDDEGEQPRGSRASAAAEPEPEPDPEADLEIDEDFLRRIREV
jgi:hypothetical protein